jgi:hypothetical protein
MARLADPNKIAVFEGRSGPEKKLELLSEHIAENFIAGSSK